MIAPRPARGRWIRRAALLAVPAALAALAAAAPLQAQDSGWPRQFDSTSGSFVIYQPQPDNLTGDLLTSRAAFSLQKPGDANPIFGALWFTEQIQIDRDSATVLARALDVTRVRLPGITPADESRYGQIVEREAARWDLSQSLEELQAGLASAEKERASVADLDNSPPRIVFMYERAILVQYDGSPVLEPIEGTRLERVANTPYAVVHDPATRTFYLAGANLWYRAQDPLGPWTPGATPPPAVRDAVPPDTVARDRVDGRPPRIVTATEPTELIAIDGQPDYAPLVDDELLYVSNTESDVVREVSTQALYVLIAGRWYRASSPAGPWTYVRGDQLPPAFAHVPPDSPKGNILASVAGTDQADDAVADTEIPQTAPIRRDATDFEVVYDGPPQFAPIEGTNLEYAVNTDAEVIFADGRYYACDQGVWYIADSPDGPWSVSETRPIGLEDIPPSCPVYDVRYVYIYDVTPTVVYVGYTPGYLGCYPYYGTVVYGTGHRYKPWRGRHHYYPRRCTWGFYPRFNPWLSRWSFGFSYCSGFLHVGVRWHTWRRPGHRPRPPMWFGPGGYHRPMLERDRTLIRTRPPRDWRPRLSDRTPMNLYNRTENVARVDRKASRVPLHPAAGPLGRPLPVPNDVFAGKDGRIYQRDPSGKWKVNQGSVWKPTVLPKPVPVSPLPKRGEGRGAPATPPAQPPVKPAPTPVPVQPRTPGPRPGFVPPPRPVAPPISPNPGNLEREFHGRERTNPLWRPAPPPPKQAPPPKQPPPPKEKPKPGGKS